MNLYTIPVDSLNGKLKRFIMKRKRGRPRKENIDREANGRATRSIAPPANEAPLALRRKVFGLSEKDAKDQKAGSFVGRLRLIKQNNPSSENGISETQYEAALRYLELRNLFYKQIGAEEAIYERGAFVDISLDDEGQARRWQSIKQRWNDIGIAIQAKQNESRGNLFAALDYCVVRDQSHGHMIGDLRLALNAIAAYFGMEKQRRAA